MYIVNRHNYVVTDAPLIITNDTNPTTGNQGIVWAGGQPDVVTGAGANMNAGEGGTNITGARASIDQYISTAVAIELKGTLTAGQYNNIRIPLNKIGVHGIRGAFGVVVVGVYNPNSIESTITTSASVQKTNDNVVSVAIIRDALFLRIPAASIALFQNKIVCVEIKHNK